MKDFTGKVIRKLTATNDQSFMTIDFSLALDEGVGGE